MKKIALVEHFITPEFIKYTQTDFDAMHPEDVKMFLKKLSDFDEIRLEEMDKAGIDISVLSLTDPGVQRENDTRQATTLAAKLMIFSLKK